MEQINLLEFKRQILVEFLSELENEDYSKLTVRQLRKKVETSEEYVENAGHVFKRLVMLKEEHIRREEKEEQIRREEKEEQIRREEKEEQIRREKIEKEDKDRAERIRLEELKTEQLKIGQQVIPINNNVCVEKNDSQVIIRKLVTQMNKYNEYEEDISTYFARFQLLANKFKLPAEHWTDALMELLPSKIGDLLTREGKGLENDYDKLKELCFQTYKLSPEKLRQLYFSHVKKSKQTWKDFVYELKNYFTGWIEGLQCNSFEALYDLMIVDQLKKSLPKDIKEYFLNDWCKFVKPDELAKRVDEYEIICQDLKIGACGSKINGKIQNESNYKRADRNFRVEINNKNRLPIRPNYHNISVTPSERYERRHTLQCYECGSTAHLRSSCPKLTRRKDETSKVVNNLKLDYDNDSLGNYIEAGKLNNKEVNILRDTGSNIDITSKNYVDQIDYTGETVWVGSILSDTQVALPLASICLETSEGKVNTKVAILDKPINEKYEYLLGNNTYELMKFSGDNVEVNVVETRSKTITRKKEEMDRHYNKTFEIEGKESSDYEEVTDIDGEVNNGEENPKDQNIISLPILNVNYEEFKQSQNDCSELKPLIEIAKENSKKGNKYISTSICLTSRYPDAVPIGNLDSPSVINAMLQLFSRCGFPRTIQMDQGSVFKSELTTTFLRKFGVKMLYSSVYHPQSNPVERFHRTMKKLMKTLCQEAAYEWEDKLPMILFALRNVEHSSLGFSPAELVFGNRLRSPMSLIYEQWEQPNDAVEEQQPVTEYVYKLINRIKRTIELAHKQLEDTRLKIPIPRFLYFKRKYFQGKRANDRLLEHPYFRRKLRLMERKQKVHGNEDGKKKEVKLREEMKPKFEKMDIDYQKLHGALAGKGKSEKLILFDNHIKVVTKWLKKHLIKYADVFKNWCLHVYEL